MPLASANKICGIVPLLCAWSFTGGLMHHKFGSPVCWNPSTVLVSMNREMFIPAGSVQLITAINVPVVFASKLSGTIFVKLQIGAALTTAVTAQKNKTANAASNTTFPIPLFLFFMLFSLFLVGNAGIFLLP